jgi:hypothetical protein
VGLTSKDFLGYATLLALYLNKSCATQVLARKSLSLSLLLVVHIVLLQIAVGPNAISSNVAGSVCETSLDESPELGWARTFKPSGPIHKASAKASAHLAFNPKTHPCHLQGLSLPGVS